MSQVHFIFLWFMYCNITFKIPLCQETDSDILNVGEDYGSNKTENYIMASDNALEVSWMHKQNL